MVHQNFWSLTKHFVYDLFHFDGKFFDTLKYLLFSPGRVPKEYTRGKRVAFLDPIRMYLFTSAVFFLIFYSMPGTTRTSLSEELTAEERKEQTADYRERLSKNPQDTAIRSRLAILEDTTRKVTWKEVLGGMPFELNGRPYKSLREYDSVQRSLPASQREGWIGRTVNRKMMVLHEENHGDKEAVSKAFFNDFVHRFPYILFISLPFFAGLLKLLYRRQREYYYSDHAIFTIYHYIISFILMLITFGFTSLGSWTGWKIFSWLGIAVILWWWVYLYKSMRRFYGQSRGKTIAKFLILTFLASIIMILLFSIFLFITAYQI